MKILIRLHQKTATKNVLKYIVILAAGSGVTTAATDLRTPNLSLLDAAKHGESELVASGLSDGASTRRLRSIAADLVYTITAVMKSRTIKQIRIHNVRNILNVTY